MNFLNEEIETDKENRITETSEQKKENNKDKKKTKTKKRQKTEFRRHPWIDS